MLVEVSGELPDPGPSESLDELVTQLRRLKIWAGDPSYESIKNRVNAAWMASGRPTTELAGKSTVADCFRPGRQRLNTDLVLAVVEVLHPDTGYLTQWRQALRTIANRTSAALQVRVQDSLPQGVPGFTGRDDEVEWLRRAVQRGRRTIMISGMPGVGKTGLAVHTAQMVAEQRRFDRIFFVSLRGFHTDPAQPPADPSAVLGALLRLLGVPVQQLPRDLAGRVAAYHDCLTDTRVLVVLDDAADTDQIRPLTANSPGSLTLVSSRRHLSGLPDATHLSLDVFSPRDGERFLAHAVHAKPLESDTEAVSRIARRCGYLPLALGLVAGHIRALPDWTLTDHADRLDKRHDEQRLDTTVEHALDVSYRHLPPAEQQLMRLLALHPGHDTDEYAAAALTGTGLNPARRHLRRLSRDNLLQTISPDRYTFHDLVRAYAIGRVDDESPSAQRAALTRLFDYYLDTAATAMNILFPAETHLRPPIRPSCTPMPDLTDPDTALAWLDTERPALVTIAAQTATQGWPTRTIRLSLILGRYLTGGHHTDALSVHSHAHHAAQHTGDLTDQARALSSLGTAHQRLGQHRSATNHFRQALDLFRQTGHRAGQAGTLNSLGLVETWQGRYRAAARHHEQSLTLFQQIGDLSGQARALGSLANVEKRLGRYQPAADHHEQALSLMRQTGNRSGEAAVLNSLGGIEGRLGQYETAGDHLQQALHLFRQAGDRTGEAWVLGSIGTLHTRLAQPIRATEHHQRALEIHRATGDRCGEACTLNGLGDAAYTAGQPVEALEYHAAALAIAVDINDRYQQARAHTGLGHAHHALQSRVPAQHHYQNALSLYTDLGTDPAVPDIQQIRRHLTDITANPRPPQPRERLPAKP